MEKHNITINMDKHDDNKALNDIKVKLKELDHIRKKETKGDADVNTTMFTRKRHNSRSDYSRKKIRSRKII